MLFDLNQNLTTDPRDSLIAGTHKGQAHFAGTGPKGKTCRECQHWREGGGVSHRYYSSGGKHGPRLKPHPCWKFKAMTGAKGLDVPHNARACKYFEQSDDSPAIFDPRVR